MASFGSFAGLVSVASGALCSHEAYCLSLSDFSSCTPSSSQQKQQHQQHHHHEQEQNSSAPMERSESSTALPRASSFLDGLDRFSSF